MTSHAKTCLTASRFETDSRSYAVHQPFERNGLPFERLELSVRKNLPSVRTARAIRSKKFAIRSNGSSYPFEKICHPFARLELSVRKNLPSVRTARAIRSKKFAIRSHGSSNPFKRNNNKSAVRESQANSRLDGLNYQIHNLTSLTDPCKKKKTIVRAFIIKLFK